LSRVRRFLPFLALLLGINLFVISYLGQERYIYFWDYSGYWIMYQDFGDLLKQDPFQALIKLITTIRQDDYNLLPVLPLMPFHFFFGDGRLPYILAIANLYLLPSVLLFFLLFKTTFSLSPGKPSFLPYLSSFILSLLPQLWIPALRGLPDGVGVLIIMMILLLYFRRPIEEQTLFNLVPVSLLLVLLILMRRWYAFWVVSFFITLFFDGVIFKWPVYRFEFRKYVPVLRNGLGMGILSVLLFFLIATPVAERMALTDYADIYSAYRDYDSLLVPVKMIYDYFGFIPFFLFLAGSLLSMVNKETRRHALFLFLQMTFTFCLFSRTQNYSYQHVYLLIPTIAIFISLFAIRILDSRAVVYRMLFLVPFVFVYSVNFSCVFIPKAYAYFERFVSPVSGIRHFPPVRGDITAIHDVLTTLDRLIQSKNDLVYVLSSSMILNEDILMTASRMNHMTVHHQMLPVSHVDKRDGFPRHFFDAKYVVLGEPIQYHLRPSDQRVIGILGDQILHQEKIGSSYERLPYAFSLDNNVRVSIYERKRPVKKADVEELSKSFIGHYPVKESLFKIYRLPCEIYDEAPTPPVKALSITYGDKVKFLGISTAQLPGNRLEVSYSWQVLGDLGGYISFVHFTNPGNETLFQNDHPIGPVRSYKELIGKFINETYFVDIPPSAVNKEIHVKVGIFSPERGDRLGIKSSGEIPTDDSNTRATVGKIKF
jgi:hypothetical protein